MTQPDSNPHPLTDEPKGQRMQVKFKHWTCDLQKARYCNGRTALVLVDPEDGERVTTATVNLPDEPLAEGEVFIKDYAENEGMVAALQEAGVVQPTGRVVVSGYVTVPVCKLVGAV